MCRIKILYGMFMLASNVVQTFLQHCSSYLSLRRNYFYDPTKLFLVSISHYTNFGPMRISVIKQEKSYILSKRMLVFKYL